MKWWLLTLLFLFYTTPVSAITVSISTPSASIDQDQEISLDTFVSCSNCGDSYLRGVFFETGDNYFGFTQNNSGEWTGTSSDRTKYFKISKEEIKDGTWSGILKLKVDKDNPFYKGPGNYSLKVGRYTASVGSSAIWSDSFFLNISGPTPTSISTPTPTPVSNNTPTQTLLPTSTSTPTPIKPTSTPTPTKTPTPTLRLTPEIASDSATLGAVLGLETPSASPTTGTAVEGSKKFLPLAIAAALVGMGLAMLAGVLVWQKRRGMIGERKEV